MTELPTGTVTFLFSDIEGSTKLLQRLGDAYPAILVDHERVLASAIESAGGVVVNTEGDAFFAVFRSAMDAVRAATEAQRMLAAHPWPDDIALRVRMGLHTGEGRLGGRDYVGLDVHRAARIMSAGHGGQVVLSEATRGLIAQALPERVTLRDLGEHRLKDLTATEHLYQLAIEGLPAEFPQLRTLDARPNNLPAQLTRFIGRREILGDVVRLLDDTRLLSLTGPGGTGKTRLGLQTAVETIPRFKDGAWFIDLSATRDPGLVASTIADALGVMEEGGRPLPDTLGTYLAEREILLVLDNFEQVTEAGDLVQQLLRTAPGLKVLVTTRVPLHVYGEREYPVPPLALPDRDHLPDLATLSQYEAVALFIDRAIAVKPDFTITNENAPAVAEICARLDGLPLAIELAASRVKLLTPDAILRRLEHALPLLTGGARDLPERQRTLRGAVEWSYDLLDDPERKLFARLAVFMGGCTLEAAEDVCDAAGDLGIDVFDGLESLLDKSLARQREMADGEPRFLMLETIREYALERLEDFDPDPTRRRHADHFRRFAEAAEPNILGEEAALWLDRCEREHDNLRAALRWAVDAREAEIGMRTASSLWRFWQQRGHLSEGRRWLDEIVDMPEASARTATRSTAVAAAGSIAYWQGEYAAMEVRYEEALDIAREVGDRRLLAESLLNYSFVFALREDRERNREVLEQAAGIFEELGDGARLAGILQLLAYNKLGEGRTEEALEDIRRTVDLVREGGNRFELAETFTALGQMHHLVGRHDEALGSYRDALAMFREVKNPSGIAMTLDMIATTESAAGRHERALRLGGAASAIHDRIGGGAPRQMTQVTDAREEARTAGALDDEAIERLWAEGRGMDQDAASELALAVSPQEPRG